MIVRANPSSRCATVVSHVTSLPPMGNIWFLSCSTLHYVHQLVANFFCMPFGDEQVQCTVGFSLAILLKTAVSVVKAATGCL